MQIRWINEQGKASDGGASDLWILLDLMHNGDLDWMPDLLRLEFAYPDDRFFPVWERGKGMLTEHLPMRFADEVLAYHDRRQRFNGSWSREPHRSIKTMWVYDDEHQTQEYLPDFACLADVLATLPTVPRLVRFEAAYDGLSYFPLWTREDGYVWSGLPPRYQQDHVEHLQRQSLFSAN